jgi:hypothetical protein
VLRKATHFVASYRRPGGNVTGFDVSDPTQAGKWVELLKEIAPRVARRSRGAGACRRLAKLMADLGWTAVRVRGLTRGGYLEQVRGYCREPLSHA